MHSEKNRALFWGILLVCLVIGGLLLLNPLATGSTARAQIPTGSIPTVTGTPMSAYAIILDNEQGYVNVRSGPGTVDYDTIGTLLPGQQVAVTGRSPGGEWIQIAYPGVPDGIGWVYTYLVDARGNIPIVEPPPTITPLVTSTIDPTLAAQFLVEVTPTRLPTYTPPPPLAIPTFPAETSPGGGTAGVPMGMVIVGMAVVGLFGTLISILRGR